MKKTETLLRDGERLIRARLNEAEQFKVNLKFVLKDKETLVTMRDEALEQALKAEQDRMTFKLMTERLVASKEHQFTRIENKKNEIRKFNEQLIANVRGMSTKIPINFTLEAQSDEGVEERHKLSDIINELNMK